MDAWINPITRDYEVDASGALVLAPGSTGLANALYLRLMTPLGSYWANPAIGSRLYELRKAKALPATTTAAIQYARTALQPILDAGRATSIDVAADMEFQGDATGWLMLLITVVDAIGQQSVFKFPVKVA